jgi:3-phenylpropionate/trans-cinnamate dioxygenase ferredoxin subunit
VTERRVAAVDDVPVGRMIRVDVGGLPVCLAHASDGAFYAFDDRCPHEGASLSEGDLDGVIVECPLHSSVFDIRSGDVLGPPARDPLDRFPVRVADGFVHICGPKGSG